MRNISTSEIEKKLVDINGNDVTIPEKVLSYFWKEKKERGSFPMGISFYNDMWYIVSPSLEDYIMKTFEH